jgi:hypothetical protein
VHLSASLSRYWMRKLHYKLKFSKISSEAGTIMSQTHGVTGGKRKLHDEELHNLHLHLIQIIIMIINVSKYGSPLDRGDLFYELENRNLQP